MFDISTKNRRETYDELYTQRDNDDKNVRLIT